MSGLGVSAVVVAEDKVKVAVVVFDKSSNDAGVDDVAGVEGGGDFLFV